MSLLRLLTAACFFLSKSDNLIQQLVLFMEISVGVLENKGNQLIVNCILAHRCACIQRLAYLSKI